ncbi:YheC/YheD family protein [Bacillus sp. MUM 13]|uniref:YheC/YheD family endospore coat-associated protein n=1 Tax=Bacillus sp. MUM 13 TaxID=1678001 RepID=UPI0009F4F10F|nr:YheC/YheD family protein [Bacillus sp. MUM 13]
MNIHYVPEKRAWLHQEGNQKLYFNKGSAEILYSEHIDSAENYPFHVLPFKKTNVLSIGILTCKNNKHETGIGGNVPLFCELHKHLTEEGIFSFVMTIEDVLLKNNKGYIIVPHTGKWEEVQVPLPDIVYNRIPSRSIEATSRFKKVKDWFGSESIFMFNPCFLDKYEMHTTFSKDPALHCFLPDTIMAGSETSLQKFIENHKTIYLKPKKGNRGNGIFLAALHHDGCITANEPHCSISFENFEAFWKHYSKQFKKKNYLAQQAIMSKKIDGHRYDFRVLVHYSFGVYSISGKAVRMSQSQEITTHVPNGGKLYPYKLLRTGKLDATIQDIAQRCGTILSEHFGFFGEFSMDLGEDETGNIYLYEVNSKPMQFDETAIEKKRLKQLSSLFKDISKFSDN